MESMEDKKRQRDKYEILVDSDIKSIRFNADFLENVMKFFFGTIVLGAFFMWCSSNNDSNFFVFINKHKDIFYQAIVILPTILWIIYFILMIKKVTILCNQINIQYEQNYVAQREIFGNFIKKQLCNDKTEEITYKDVLYLYENAKDDITFDFNEFVKYIDSWFMKYKLKFPFNFSYHFSYLVLYNEEICGTLIKQNTDEYTFIVKENRDFLMKVL